MAAGTIHSDFGAPLPKKSVTASIFSSSISHEVMGPVLSQLFQSPPSPSSRGSLVPLRFLPLKWYHPYIWGFPCNSAGKESNCNVGDLGWEDPLEKEKATYSSILAWRIPWTV